MAAVSASPPIRATAAAYVAVREAGLSIKPLLSLATGNTTAPTATATVRCSTNGGVLSPSL